MGGGGREGLEKEALIREHVSVEGGQELEKARIREDVSGGGVGGELKNWDWEKGKD